MKYILISFQYTENSHMHTHYNHFTDIIQVNLCWLAAQLKNGGFCQSKVLLLKCWWQLQHLDYGENASSFDSVTYTASTVYRKRTDIKSLTVHCVMMTALL